MDAMNAALEDSEHETSGHSSLRSVDVMDEAMNLLLSAEAEIVSGMEDIQVGDEKDFADDDDVEEIDFADFLAPASTDPPKTESNKTSGDEESDNSPTSVLEAGEKTDSNNKDDIKPSSSDDDEFLLELPNQPQVVPLKQFENALALIQDLENRIQVLETDQQCLLEENEQLRETTNQQATAMADMEAKLERFPKLLEQTVQEEAQLAAKQAEAETKVSFWRKDMARQEQEERDKQLAKKRVGKHGATTESLKQADFLKDVVDRKEQEGSAAKTKNNNNKGPGAIFQAALRSWGNHRNGIGVKNTALAPSKRNSSLVGGVSGEAIARELSLTKSHDSHEGGGGRTPKVGNDEEDEPSERSIGIDDQADDTKVLDLMT